MNFYCPLCEEEWIITTRLCNDCSKIKRFMKLYSKEIVCNMVSNVLLVNNDKINIKTAKQVDTLLLLKPTYKDAVITNRKDIEQAI